MKNPNIIELIYDGFMKAQSDRIASAGEVLAYMTSVMRGECESEMVVIDKRFQGILQARVIIRKPDARERLKAAEALSKYFKLFDPLRDKHTPVDPQEEHVGQLPRKSKKPAPAFPEGGYIPATFRPSDTGAEEFIPSATCQEIREKAEEIRTFVVLPDNGRMIHDENKIWRPGKPWPKSNVIVVPPEHWEAALEVRRNNPDLKPGDPT